MLRNVNSCLRPKNSRREVGGAGEMMLVQEASECPGKDAGVYIKGFKWGEDMKRLTLPAWGREWIEEGGQEAETA